MKLSVMITVDVHFDLGFLSRVCVESSVGVSKLHAARMFRATFILKMKEACTLETSATRCKNTGVESILTLNHRDSLRYKTLNERTFVSDPCH
jgi:hypothetical protein